MRVGLLRPKWGQSSPSGGSGNIPGLPKAGTEETWASFRKVALLTRGCVASRRLRAMGIRLTLMYSWSEWDEALSLCPSSLPLWLAAVSRLLYLSRDP